MNQKRTRHIILGTVIFFLLMFLLSPGRSTTVQAAANDNETVQIKLAEGVTATITPIRCLKLLTRNAPNITRRL